jgi:hypothetical protein
MTRTTISLGETRDSIRLVAGAVRSADINMTSSRPQTYYTTHSFHLISHAVFFFFLGASTLFRWPSMYMYSMGKPGTYPAKNMIITLGKWMLAW